MKKIKIKIIKFILSILVRVYFGNSINSQMHKNKLNLLTDLCADGEITIDDYKKNLNKIFGMK